jgi:hypothetical protein
MIRPGMLRLTLAERRRHIGWLLAFAGLFLAAGATVRLLAADPHGHPDPDRLFAIGGYPLVSGLLLLGWVLGRYPLIATLVLLAGLFSHDRDRGFARTYHVRPTSLTAVYGWKFLTLAGTAFLLAAVLMPLFDLIMLGTWAGPATFVLILANVLVYGGLTALFSVWTRADAWAALAAFIAAMVWHTLIVADLVEFPPGARDFVSLVLPPHGAMLRLEGAFAAVEPIPWDAFAVAAAYGLFALVLAGVMLRIREI